MVAEGPGQAPRLGSGDVLAPAGAAREEVDKVGRVQQVGGDFGEIGGVAVQPGWANARLRRRQGGLASSDVVGVSEPPALGGPPQNAHPINLDASLTDGESDRGRVEARDGGLPLCKAVDAQQRKDRACLAKLAPRL